MQIAPFGDNPFAILTTVVAPAVMTNACSVLCLGTANRIARVVDRSREIARELEAMPADSQERTRFQEQFHRLRRRAQKLFWALRLLYGSLGAFATAALVAVLGSGLAIAGQQWAFQVAAGVGLVAGTVGVGGVVVGCALMVGEVRLALRQIEEESALAIPSPKTD